MSGFKYYDNLPPVNPTYMTPEQAMASATLEQVQAYIDWYAQGLDATEIKAKYFINRSITNYVFGVIKKVEDLSTSLMREEVEISKGIFNTKPKDITDLKNQASVIISKLPAEWIGLCIDNIVKWSKHDGTGDWVFYSTEVVK